MSISEAKEQAEEIISKGITRYAFRSMEIRGKAFDLFNEIYFHNASQYGVMAEKEAFSNGCKSCNRRVVDGLKRFINENSNRE